MSVCMQCVPVVYVRACDRYVCTRRRGLACMRRCVVRSMRVMCLCDCISVYGDEKARDNEHETR